MEQEAFDFFTDIPQDALELLMELGGQLGVDPLGDTDGERYFCALLSQYSGSGEGLREYIKRAVERDFLVMKERPCWIQSPEWPFHNGKPMIFVGQLDTAIRRDGFRYGLSFYVFWDSGDGFTKTVSQSE